MNDLRGHAAPAKVSFGARSKIFAALFVAAGICAAVAYGYETGQFNTSAKPVVANGQLPLTAPAGGSAQ